MPFRNLPIRQKLTTVMMLTSGTVLLLTAIALIAYESKASRGAAIRSLVTVGKIIASNSTAALAFDNRSDATEVLSALRAEPQIVAAALYDVNGKIDAKYPAEAADESFPREPLADGYRFEPGYLVGVQGVEQSSRRRLGTLYVKSDLLTLQRESRLYALIAVVMTAVALLVAYLLSRFLQQYISRPIVALEHTASVLSR